MDGRRTGLYWRDRRGGVAQTFALSVLPLCAMVGVGVDYARVQRGAERVQMAADAAAIASISKAQADRSVFVSNMIQGELALDKGLTLEIGRAHV